MKIKLFIWLFAIMLLSSSVLGDITDSLVYYYKSDEASGNLTDAMGNLNLNQTGTVLANDTVILNGARGPHSDTAYHSRLTTGFSSAYNYTVSIWLKKNVAACSAINNFLNVETATGILFGSYYYVADTSFKGWVQMGTTQPNPSITQTLVNGNIYHYVLTWDTTTDNATIYINNTPSAQAHGTGSDGASSIIYVGRWSIAARSNACFITDEIAIWNRTLSSAEVNSTQTSFYSDWFGPGPTTDLYITAKDEWNSTSISSFNVNISWSNGTVTSHISSGGNVYLSNLSNGGTAYNITFWNVIDYFNSQNLSVTLVNTTNNTLIGYLHQAEVCFNSTAKSSGASVTLNNITIGSTVKTASPFCFNISAGTYSALAQKTGWYSLNQSVSITALQNNTLTIENMTYANLTISAKDATTNASLTDCNSSVKSINWTAWPGESQSGTFNDSYYLVNGTYNVSVYCSGYALDYTVANVTVSGHTNYTFTLYKTNSVSITILDEITNTPILSNITIRWTNNVTTWENITSTSSLFIYNLTPSNYTLLFYGSNYSTRTYTISVGNLTTQFLTAYMISSVYSTIFTVKDKDTGDIQSDVAFTAYKLVNSTWQAVESKYTDITGKTQMYYDPIGNYRFYLTKANYEDLIFYLNPILFDTYDVFMEKSSPLNYTVDYDDISIIYSPHSFNNNENTTFNFLISSPDGQLTTYGIKLTFPGGVKTASGVNAIGEQLSTIVNLSGATRWDRVQLDYNYTTTLAGTRTFTQYLSINTNATASENTWMANKDRTFGLGIFERVLIVTIIIIFVVGISTMVGQPIAGMALGLFMFGFLMFIGFVPIWVILPSLIIGVIFLVWKSGG